MTFITGTNFSVVDVHTAGNDFAFGTGSASIAVAFTTDAVAIAVQATATLPVSANDFTITAKFTAGTNFTVGTLTNSPAVVAFTADDVTIAVTAVQPVIATIAFSTDDVGVAVAAHYDSAVWRGLTAGTRSAHQQSTPIQIHDRDGWQQPQAKRPEHGDSWKAAPTLDHAAMIDVGGSVHPRPMQNGDAWQQASPLDKPDAAIVHKAPPPKRLQTREAWDAVLSKGWSIHTDWRNPQPKRIHRLSPWQAATQSSRTNTLGSNQAPRKLKDQRRIPWQQANPHNWVIGWPVEVIPTPPRVWPTDLVLHCKKPAWVDGLTTDLIFKASGCPWADAAPTIVIPVLRSYFVSNQATVVTLPSLTPLDVTSLNISSDIDSWCWSFSATVKSRTQLPLIKPVNGNPIEIRATINGVIWEFIVESYDESRAFANNSFSIKGRSKSAYLAEPYAPIGNDSNSVDILANQIADAAVLNTGFTIDWQVTDWLVLAGAWNHRGTPLARLTALAEAIGGSVQSATQANSLSIVKRYPALPWNWASATPFAQIPLSIILDGMGEQFVKKPDYNAVYASGEAVGVTAQIKRTGSAGDIVAPMAVSPLITHNDAARMRGESILADTGMQGNVSIPLPFYASLGLVPPGKLIEIVDSDASWRGLTRGVGINAQWQEGKGLIIRQNLEVERHYG